MLIPRRSNMDDFRSGLSCVEVSREPARVLHRGHARAKNRHAGIARACVGVVQAGIYPGSGLRSRE